MHVMQKNVDQLNDQHFYNKYLIKKFFINFLSYYFLILKIILSKE